jgi:hypothetical protein
MTNESQTVQKSEQELFDEVIAARNSGSDMGKVLENVEVIETNTEEVEPVANPEKEEVAATPPAEAPKEEDKKPVVADKAPPATEEDWSAGLPPEVQAKITALKEERNRAERDHKALMGRVPFLNRKVDELEKKLSSQRPAPEPAAEDKTPKAESLLAKKLTETRAVDPALADLIEAAVSETTQSLRQELAEKTSQTEALFRNRDEEELWKSEKAKLLERIPQADEVFQLPLYKQWKRMLPAGQAALASSMYAEDVVLALEQFARFAAVHQPELIQQPASTPAANPPVGEVATNPDAAKVADQRARKLAADNPGAAAPRPKPSSKDFDDPTARFDEITKLIREGKSYAHLLK